MDKYLGKRLDGRYEISEIIGRGGMANVYKAYDKLEDQFVALKILKDEYIDNDEFLRRFRNESKAISVLSHPNIVKVTDVSFGNNIQYIVMEYIDGITLKDYIEQSKVLSWKETIHFTMQILKALQHAHENGIVHRDIKPQNIMLLQDGTIKVMDFGIASFARDERRTTSNMAIGSVHYISPEQASGANTDEKTDIYAVGVMMYEMLTGSLPFDGTNPEQVAVMHMQAQPKSMRELNDTIPEGLEEIVVRAMQKSATMRYQSAAEMIRDIDEFKKNPSILFEYKYFSDGGSTKFFNAINPDKDSNALSFKDLVEQGESAEEEVEEKKTKTIPILAGVAAAFVAVAIIIVAIILIVGGGGVDEFIMPDLVGMQYSEVKDDPQYSNFQLVVKSAYSEEYESGEIIDQSKEAGTTVKEGTEVEITVSLGIEEVIIPDVYGLTLEKAEEAFDAQNIRYTTQKGYYPDVTEGTVAKTDPPKNEQVSGDTIVTIFVSLGKAVTQTEVPNVIGMTESDARKAIEKAGLTPAVSKVKSTKPAGEVIDQSPADGVTIAEGSKVTISVSNGKAPSQELSFSVALPSDGTGDYTFKVYLDGTQKSSRVINIDSVDTFKFSLTASSTDSTVSVMVSKSGSTASASFVKYQVNFVTGSITTVSGPNNSIFDTASASTPATPVSSQAAAVTPPVSSEAAADTTSQEEPVTE